MTTLSQRCIVVIVRRCKFQTQPIRNVDAWMSTDVVSTICALLNLIFLRTHFSHVGEEYGRILHILHMWQMRSDFCRFLTETNFSHLCKGSLRQLGCNPFPTTTMSSSPAEVNLFISGLFIERQLLYPGASLVPARACGNLCFPIPWKAAILRSNLRPATVTVMTNLGIFLMVIFPPLIHVGKLSVNGNRIDWHTCRNGNVVYRRNKGRAYKTDRLCCEDDQRKR